MKYKSKIFLIFLLILGYGKLQAQSSVGVPGWVTVTPPGGVPGGNGQAGDPLAMGAGATWTYDATPSWPAFSSTCYFFGYPTTIGGLLNMYNTSPPPPGTTVCGGMTGVTYLSGDGTNVIVYNGTTSYHYIPVGWGAMITNTTVPVHMTITFTTNPGNAAIPAHVINGYVLIHATQKFNVNVLITAFSPAAQYMAGPGANNWIPAVDLFNDLYTDPASSTCTSLTNSFYNSIVTASSANTGPYCNGGTITISSLGSTSNSAGTLTSSWTGPASYSSSYTNPPSSSTTIASATNAKAGNYILTVTDALGCPSSTSTTNVVVDIINPTITAPSTVNTTTNTGCTATGVSLGVPVTADNCSVASVTNNHPSTTYPLGTTTVTWTVTDNNGNTATANQNVVVTDNITPTITPPANINTGTNTGCTATGVSLGVPTTGDNCSVASVANDHPSTTYPLGTTTVTWTVTDGSGNIKTATQTVTVTDNVNPSFSSCPSNYSVNVIPGTCTQSVATANPITADNCGVTKLTWEMTGATTGTSPPTGINNIGTYTFNAGVTTVTYTVADAQGNINTCIYTVTVIDNIPPTITAPADMNTTTNTGCTATGVPLGVPITADNCSVFSVTNNAPGAFPLGTTTVKWTVTDGSGNATSTTTQTVTVTDNGNPTISCPGNISVNVAAGTCGQSIVTTNPTIADNCAVTKLTWIMTGANVGSSPATGINNVGTYTSNLGITTITYTDYDAAGNSATCFSTVTVTDNIAPTITCPVNVSVNVASGLCTQSVLTANPTTADNCAVTKLTWAMTGATIASSAATGINNAGTQTFNLGITTVTYTDYDAAGNQASCFFTVTVNDNINPTITCPGNYTANVAAGTCSQSVTTANPTTADNCAVTKLTWAMTGATAGASPGTGINTVSTHTFNTGVTTVTYIDYDSTGNHATCSFTVTVTDNINPTITCPGNYTVNDAAGVCSKSVTTANPTTADNCAVTKLIWTMTGATTGASGSSGINNVGTHTFNTGVTTVKYIDYDSTGNHDSCSFTITVHDTINPTITCPSNISVNVAPGTCSKSFTTTNPTTADNCAVTILAWAMTGATNATSSPTGINNVGTQTFNLGVTTVTYTDYDAAGNAGTCFYTVTVHDTINPTFTFCPGDTATTVTAGICGKLVTTTAPTTADNCAVTKLTWAMTGATAAVSGSSGINYVGAYTFNAGITTVTYTVYDAALNSTTCSYTVTVIDNDNPYFTFCPGSYSVFTAAGTCAQTVATANPITTDNCGVTKLTWAMTGATVAASGSSGINNIGTYTFNSGTTIVIYTDYDAAGNTGTCLFTVTVADNINPLIFCPGDYSVNVAPGTCSKSVITAPPTTADNCLVTKLIWAMTGATIANSPLVGINNLAPHTFNTGTTTVTYTDYDAAGNHSSCSFLVVVNDTIPPTITCQGNVVTTVAPGICAQSVATTNPTTADNCGVTSLTWAMTGATTATGINNIGTYSFNTGVTTVTYTDYDASGNSASCSFTITVNDDINPTITCPGNYSVNDAAGTCSQSVTTTNPTTADNCGVTKLIWAMTGATVANSLPSGINNVGTYTFNTGVTTVTYTDYDAAGNQASCSYTVTVLDNINPTFTSCPSNISVNVAAGTCTQSVITPPPLTADNCAVTKLTWAMTGATIASSVATGINNVGTQTFNLGITTVTYTVYDAAGNSAICSFTVTVLDNINPTITCPGNYTSNDAAGTCSKSVPTANPTTADNCSVTKLTWAMTGATVAASGSSGINNVGTHTFNTGVTTVTYIDYDAAGNPATCSFTVTVHDTINPTITCPGNYSANDAAGVCSKSVITANPTTADNCSVTKLTWAMTGATVANSGPTGINNVGAHTFNTGVTTVTYTDYDSTGNQASCSYTVTVHDTINPTITCPGPYSTNVAAGTCSKSVTTAAPATADNCAVTKLIWAMTGATIANSVASGINNVGTHTFNTGVTTVTYTDYDSTGNSATCSYTVTVHDTIPPTFTFCPIDISTNPAPGVCTKSVVTVDPTTADNCGVTKLTWAMTGATVGVSGSSGINTVGTYTFNAGITTVTYTVYDSTGNSATCAYTVTVTDNIPPTITCPGNYSANVAAGTCSQSVITADPTTADNCSVTKLTWAMTGATVAASAGTGINNIGPHTFNTGVTTVTYTVYDGAGNSAICSYTVTVHDTINPTITCPGNYTANDAAGTCSKSVITAAPTTADNCSVTKLIWAMTGATVANSAPTGINTVDTHTFNTGVTTITYIDYDSTGNSATCSYTVTVHDTINPTITCPGNYSANVAAGTCSQSIITTAPTTADNCSVTKLTWAMTGATVGVSGSSGINNIGIHTFNTGVTTVTYTDYDANGNFAACSYAVTVHDTINPTITAPTNVIATTNTGCTATGVSLGIPVTADNCSVATVTNNAPVAFPLGNTTVTWTVTDSTGNTATATQTVTVNDTVNPTITCPGNIATTVAAGLCTQSVITTNPTTADNCSVTKLTWAMTGVTIGTSIASGINTVGTYTFNLGITTITYTVFDAAGNSANCSYTVTVTDNINPTFTSCPGNISTTVAAGLCTQSVITTAPTTADNCGVTKLIWAMTGVTIDASAAIGINTVGTYTFNAGITTVTYTVFDAAGNYTTCSYTVTVNDTINPTITCSSNVSVYTAPGVCTQSVITINPTTADNCSVTKLTWAMTGATVDASAATGINNVDTYTFNLGITTVTYTAYDLAGNSATCSSTVTVIDNINPTIVCPGDTTVNNALNQCSAIVFFTAPIGKDNCSVASTGLTAGLPSGSVFPIGTTVETYTVTDGSGNTASCSFNVTVKDTQLPVIVCPGNISVNNDAGQCGAIVNYTAPIGTDNCTGATTAQTAGLASGSLFPIGTTTQIFTVTDSSHNSSSCSFTVTVADTTAPVIICPGDTTTNNNPGQCGAIVNFNTPLVTDNCNFTLVQTVGLASGSLFPIGATTQTFVATDSSGNSSTCSFIITIKDNESPVVNCTHDTAVCDNGSNIINYITPTSTDNCPGLTVAQTTGLPSGSAFPIGITINTFEFTDASGNKTLCVFKVTVHPLPIITFNNVPPVCEADPTFTLSVAIPTGGTYNGLGITNNTFNPAGTGTGTFPITYTFTDTNGCSSTSATTITVNPNPTVTLSNLGTFSNRITPFALSGGVPVGGTYSGAGVTSNVFDPKTAGLGIHQITYTYTNSSGCSDSAIAPIEVIDGSAIIIYNALTPNGDGIDDTWIIKNIDKFPGNKVQIFNRWGTKVFEATNYNNEWNGGNLPQASYFYLLDLNNGDKTLKGTVTIIR